MGSVADILEGDFFSLAMMLDFAFGLRVRTVGDKEFHGGGAIVVLDDGLEHVFYFSNNMAGKSNKTVS